MPQIKVDTFAAKEVEVSYFITNKGNIFIWPPIYDEISDSFFIDGNTSVKTKDGEIISKEKEYQMYQDGFTFLINGISIKISNNPARELNILVQKLSTQELQNMYAIFYKDEKNAKSPQGIETKYLYYYENENSKVFRENIKFRKGSKNEIIKTDYSYSFPNEIEKVESSFLVYGVPDLIGEQMYKNNAITESQAYNFLAKGANTPRISDIDAKHTWLSRSRGFAIPCTRIEKVTAKESIGIDLPIIKVNTLKSKNVEVSYFVTRKGDIFIWPPYEDKKNDMFFVNKGIPVKTLEGEAITSKTQNRMYEEGFEFDINGVSIKISAQPQNTYNVLKGNIASEELKNIPSIYYKDQSNAESPEGIESKFIYDDRAGENPSKIKGVDKD